MRFLRAKVRTSKISSYASCDFLTPSPFLPCRLIDCKKAAAVAIGIGGLYSGVPFHMHGPGFSEVLHGSKRWFLASPEVRKTHSPF